MGIIIIIIIFRSVNLCHWQVDNRLDVISVAQPTR